jgi:hypothetical protein
MGRGRNLGAAGGLSTPCPLHSSCCASLPCRWCDGPPPGPAPASFSPDPPRRLPHPPADPERKSPAMVLTDPPYLARYRDHGGRTVPNDDSDRRTAQVSSAAHTASVIHCQQRHLDISCRDNMDFMLFEDAQLRWIPDSPKYCWADLRWL